MKKLLLSMLIFTFSLLLTGCKFIEEKKAEDTIKIYYQAIMDEDYEKAFEQLYVYDDESKTDDSKLVKGSTRTDEEAKVYYFKKIDILKEQNYKLNDFEIVEVEYEDGHSFWHHIKLDVEQNGQKFEWNEVADIYNGKLLIGETDDPFAQYRDGKLN